MKKELGVKQVVCNLTSFVLYITRRVLLLSSTLRKKFPYSELFWSAFFPHFPSVIRTEYGEIGSVSPYSFQMWENAGKIWTRITPDTDTFYAVQRKCMFLHQFKSI